MFLSLHDAKMRLEHCLIRHKKEPAYVHQVTQPRVNYLLSLEYVKTQKVESIPLIDRGLDFSPVPLGNMNHEGQVYYTARAPQRMWKQGLHGDNFICRSMDHGYVGISLMSKALVATIKGDYPTIQYSFDMIEIGMMKGSAFSRNYSLIAKRVIVFNSKNKIGVMHDDLRSFTLNNEYMYLKEHLQHSMRGH